MERFIILGSILLITTVGLIRAEFIGSIRQRYIFKPLSAALMITVLLLSFTDNPQFSFSLTLLVGMLLCAGGDISLMFESNKAFTFGLVLFLLGHIVYTFAIARFIGLGSENMIISVIIILLAFSMFAFLFSGLRQMKLPVLLYIIAISVMVHTAAMTFYSGFFNLNQARALFFGALLFYLSDVFLAINRFKKPFRLNRVSLLFYFGGQFLIALSPALA